MDHSTRPAGFTLIEILVVLGIVSIVVGSMAVALGAMFQVDRRMREDLAYSVSFPRLSIQVRQDAHAAHSAIISSGEGGSSMLTMQLADEQVVSYAASADRLVRVVRRGAEQLHREVFPLKAVNVLWELDEERRFVRLWIERNAGEIAQAEDSLRVELIEAAVGLNTMKRAFQPIRP